MTNHHYLKHCGELRAPIVHLIGNHELRAFSRSEVENVYHQVGVDPVFFGIKEFSSFRILWLDVEIDNSNNAFLPSNTLAWLRALPVAEKPTLVFSHYSLVPIDERGTFYFEKQPNTMYLENADQVRELLSKFDPKLHINGHVHLLTHQQYGNAHYISAPSFSENIAGEAHLDNNPAIFSILELNDSDFVFSTYSGQFCFAKIQGKTEKTSFF